MVNMEEAVLVRVPKRKFRQNMVWKFWWGLDFHVSEAFEEIPREKSEGKAARMSDIAPETGVGANQFIHFKASDVGVVLHGVNQILAAEDPCWNVWASRIYALRLQDQVRWLREALTSEEVNDE